MTAGMLSLIIPSRNERFLCETIRDVLSKAVGPVECVVIADGYWPGDEGKTAPLPKEILNDKRVKILHHGKAQGMRPSINAAVQIATGEFLMKLDAHCMVAEGFDEVLKADHHEDNWLVVPRRYALEPVSWTFEEGNPKYPVDYHFLSNAYERPDDPTCGMHGTPWTARRDARKHLLLDEEMSSQGSCWVIKRSLWDRLGDMEIERYGNFYMELQELGLKVWLGGGAIMVNKRTWYAHLRKGQRFRRGYSLGVEGHRRGKEFGVDFWMKDQWSGAVRPMRWLVERFAPVPSWPADLDEVFNPALRASQLSR